MKRILLIPFLLLALTACADTGKLGQLLTVTTTTITNPVSAIDIYRVKNAYAASLQLAVDYRKFCWSRPYVALLADPLSKPLCQSRRGAVRAIQLAQVKAHSALSDAEIFVLNNPTLNATNVISAAWTAVTNFQNAVPVVK